MAFENESLLKSRFFYETLSLCGIQCSQLQITSVCNANCFFCSNNQNPFEIKREGFRSLKEIKTVLKLMHPGPYNIALNDSLPGRISEGEALIHPQLFEILTAIRKKFPKNKLHITTNASKLTEDMILKLKKFNPIEIQISYHSNNVENWCKIFKLRKQDYYVAKNSFALLKKNNFVLHATMTPLPNLLGYKDLEKTIKFILQYTPRLNFYFPGFTKFSSEWVSKVMDVDLIKFSKFVDYLNKKYKMNYGFSLDPLKPLNLDPLPIMKKTEKFNFKNVLWLVSESAYERLKIIVEKNLLNVNNKHTIFLTKNKTYGGNIICSQLLMVDDFRKAIKEALKNDNYDLILIPKMRSVDLFGEDLCGESYDSLYAEFPFVTFWEE